ncbi:hypothetical protein [Bacillus sp. JCM 19041]|uniref:hypothetical protein n=1 Tax=Bacillus sp. JCM 19041 TaxID=1460637 RepID=UPI0012E1AA3E
MMKSWISVFLPKDEYKEKKILFFIAEGSMIAMLGLIMMLIASSFVDLSLQVVLLAAVALNAGYITVKYTISGMEFTDVASRTSFKREVKGIIFGTIRFAIIFFILQVLMFRGEEWSTLVAVAIIAGVFWFMISYVSLRSSFKKNKNLLDE